MVIHITHPTDFPPSFLEAYRQGKLVFFCGAGISNYGSALPAYYASFKALVRAVLDCFDPSWESNIHTLKYQLYEKYKYDELLENLDEDYGRDGIHSHIKSLFQNRLPIDLQLNHHSILLNLARPTQNQGFVQLVTTNFDTCFSMASGNERIKEFYAPLLPIPRGEMNYPHAITYLHGNVSDPMLENNLIYSSSDFGKAYISDGYAARFISELTKNYTICFIGYSVNDPIMRYTLSGVKAVKRETAEAHTPEIFTLTSFSDNSLERRQEREALELLGLSVLEFENYPAMWHCLETWYTYQTQDIFELARANF